ncbi:hypothetical protein AKJ16_DCAP04195 [Drosera capensis]
MNFNQRKVSVIVVGSSPPRMFLTSNMAWNLDHKYICLISLICITGESILAFKGSAIPSNDEYVCIYFEKKVQKFKALRKEMRMKPLKPLLDVRHRCNSTYLILKRAVQYKEMYN